MTGFRMVESVGDHEVKYNVEKNGTHSGVISASLDGQPIIDDLNFTTAAELAGALNRAQLAILSRISVPATMRSIADSSEAEDFMKNSVEYLRSLGNRFRGGSDG